GRPEDHWRQSVAAQGLVEQRQLELAEPRSAEVLVEKERPQAPVLHLLLERVCQRLGLGVPGPGRAREHQVERLDLGATELLDPVELLLELGLSGEVPGHALPPSLVRARATVARGRPWPATHRCPRGAWRARGLGAPATAPVPRRWRPAEWRPPPSPVCGRDRTRARPG